MTIIAKYWDNYEVIIDEDTLKLRGSFEPEGGPHAREPEVIKWFFEQAQKHKKPVVLDIGACTGSYSLLSKFYDMEIHAFEPTPRTFVVLEKNVKLNALEDRTKIYNFAIGGANERATFHVVVHDGSVALSMLEGKPANHKETKAIVVDVVTVDTFCQRRSLTPNLIKIDTEGAEKFVVLGALNTIRRCHPTILCEYSAQNTLQYGYNPHVVKDILESEGYKCIVDGPEMYAIWRG